MTQDMFQPLTKKTNRFAVFLSFFIIGAGQIYAGATERGIIHLVIGFILGTLSLETGVFFIFFVPFWIWGMYDADSKVDDFNRGIDIAALKQQSHEREMDEYEKSTFSASEFVSQLEKISKLQAAGVLDPSEYTTRKKDLILSLDKRKPRESAEDFLAALIPSIEKKNLDEQEISQLKAMVFKRMEP